MSLQNQNDPKQPKCLRRIKFYSFINVFVLYILYIIVYNYNNRILIITCIHNLIL